jgi:predicted O-methyltransferase YrrM
MITSDDVTVVIPSLPERGEQLERAVASVWQQTTAPFAVVTHIDHKRQGAHAARNAALAKVQTEWVAFLDDDDTFHPDHLETLIDGANETGADVIGSYPEPDHACEDALVVCHNGQAVRGPVDVPWGPEQMDHLDARDGAICPHCDTPRGSFIMFTNLVRRSLIDKIGGVPAPGSMGDHFAGWGAEDYLFLLALKDAGAKFHHVTGKRTWTYHVAPLRLVDIARDAITMFDALQKGPELASFLALVKDVGVKTVLEIGADKGGTLWAWRQLGCDVIAITLEDGIHGSAPHVKLNEHGCQVIYGDSHDDKTVVQLEVLLGGRQVDMLFIDGDHTFYGVKSDYEMYQRFVRDGGLIAFHDICDHPYVKEVNVKAFWDTLAWPGDREEIITDPRHWGGIGVLRVPVAA